MYFLHNNKDEQVPHWNQPNTLHSSSLCKSA